MTEKPISLYLHMSEHFDVHFAALAFEDYTGIRIKLTHGTFWGGWHGGESTDDYLFELFMNPYNVGHGVEYHRPECPDALVLIHLSCTPDGFRRFEDQLADKPGIRLLNTGFEKNIPSGHRFKVGAPRTF